MKHSRSRLVRTLVALSISLGMIAGGVATAGSAQADTWGWTGSVTR